MIAIPGQPLAQRILRATLKSEHPPQQLLFQGPAGTGKREAAHELAWQMMDPAGRHERTDTALDLTEVRPPAPRSCSPTWTPRSRRSTTAPT